MKVLSFLKRALLLLFPIFILPLIAIPYQWLNSEYLVKWLGCGCPQVDEFGNTVYPAFNANDFSACFWAIICLLDLIALFPLSGKLVADDTNRLIYRFLAAVVVLITCCLLYSFMMWD